MTQESERMTETPRQGPGRMASLAAVATVLGLVASMLVADIWVDAALLISLAGFAVFLRAGLKSGNS